MPQMLEMIRNSKVPANLMQSAARGSLSVPAGEMIEILVYLALHNKVLSDQARLTLAGWDENSCVAAAADPATSAEVLGYFVALENARPQLLPALAENPSVTEEAIAELAAQGARPVAEVLFVSRRVTSSPLLLRALEANANLHPNERAEIGKKLAALETSVPEPPDDGTRVPDAVLEEALTIFLKENAAELETEKDKPFQAIGGIHDDGGEAARETVAVAETSTAVAAESAPGSAAGGATSPAKKAQPAAGDRRDSPLQKIARLDIKGRIGLAMRGSKEDRSILIRDGTKLVALAVLDSPKISDSEVEKIALQKNVQEAVLRAIPLRRRFAKNYNIMRNLVFNPRTPLDQSLGLMKKLLVHDLKNLAGNKEVPETIRKLALRMHAQKKDKKG